MTRFGIFFISYKSPQMQGLDVCQQYIHDVNNKRVNHCEANLKVKLVRINAYAITGVKGLNAFNLYPLFRTFHSFRATLLSESTKIVLWIEDCAGTSYSNGST